ncbi:Trafficking protein particle complex subunit 12 [Cytospora mali]|uniref:Trafficking protein particle complex subunit 12 n=1 Tax=Cytospora mali TaxID=578113 RepID=A0A194V0K0_CYTMA|nr:Trafficking protein particle complex subunit 12 [Valsa mali var. pyri (nom. inval.)]
MDQSQTLPSRGHVRNKSSTAIASRPRSSTKGPLDAADDPLNPPRSPLPQVATRLIPSRPLSRQGNPRLPSPRLPADRRHSSRSPAPHRVGSPAISAPKDFSYLLRPEIYQSLTPTAIPAPFRNSQRQPTPDTPIAELLANGHFRAAAIAAVQALTGSGGQPAPAPTDHARIFELLYVRLSCLTLIDATQVAAQEVRALEDVNSVFYMDDITGAHLVPWDLRVLVVRLQAMGFGDPRRAVMSYYDLAREARARVAEALAGHDNSASEVWKGRLVDLGVKVAGALVEMDDLAGAKDHLAGLRDQADGKLGMAKALLWLHLGDTAAARRCIQEGDSGERIIAALCAVADGEYEAALSAWRELREEMDGDEMVAVNLAVCLLYTGRMEEGREILEGLVDNGYSSHTLLFNLTTMYELCTDRSKSLKGKLAEKVAGMEPTPRGWEKSNVDFKL